MSELLISAARCQSAEASAEVVCVCGGVTVDAVFVSEETPSAP